MQQQQQQHSNWRAKNKLAKKERKNCSSSLLYLLTDIYSQPILFQTKQIDFSFFCRFLSRFVASVFVSVLLYACSGLKRASATFCQRKENAHTHQVYIILHCAAQFIIDKVKNFCIFASTTSKCLD